MIATTVFCVSLRLIRQHFFVRIRSGKLPARMSSLGILDNVFLLNTASRAACSTVSLLGSNNVSFSRLHSQNVTASARIGAIENDTTGLIDRNSGHQKNEAHHILNLLMNSMID